MFLFGKKSKIEKKSYDTAKLSPAIRCSICTGEQTAGFVEIESGAFHDVALIRSPQDLEDFKKTYGIADDIKKIY